MPNVKSLIKVFLQHALFCDACDRCLYMISDAVSISRQFKFVDHVYFVHPSTDISVDISICDGRHIGRHIGRLSAGISGCHDVEACQTLKGTSTLTKSSLQITRNNFKNQVCLKF